MLSHHQLSNKFVHIELKLFDWMMMKLTKALSKTMNFTAKRQMLKFLSKKFGFLVVDGNNLALDIARTTDYGDNWAFKNSDPIHHRDTWIYNHSLSWQLRGTREGKYKFLCGKYYR